MATSRGKISDAVDSGILRAADGDGTGEVVVGNEQYATVSGVEDASGRDEVKGPDDVQWPAEARDMRLKVNRAGGDEEDGAEGYVKGPDPAQHPEREAWADKVGVLDPDAEPVLEDTAPAAQE